MNSKRLLLVYLFIGIHLAFISCKKDNSTVKPSFIRCNDLQKLDSLTIYSKLVGSWSLKLRNCFNSPTPLQPVETQKVEFKVNNSFQVYNDNSVLASGIWGLKNLGNNNWGLNLSNSSPLLQGRILYCEDVLIFDSTYVNGVGCSSYFFRQ